MAAAVEQWEGDREGGADHLLLFTVTLATDSPPPFPTHKILFVVSGSGKSMRNAKRSWEKRNGDSFCLMVRWSWHYI